MCVSASIRSDTLRRARLMVGNALRGLLQQNRRDLTIAPESNI
jgi:hypothetical protein